MGETLGVAHGRPPVLVEIAGPAGAGKSSLARALSEREGLIRAGVRIAPHRYLPDACALVPTFVRFHRPFRGIKRLEMKRVLHLTTLSRVLDGLRGNPPRICILDEGPVYMLARMLYLSSDAFDNVALREWWRAAAGRWASSLRLVVWLDADTGVLTRRIRTRRQPPPVPDTSDASLIAFLTRYRSCYEAVLTELRRSGSGPTVLALDTSATSMERMIDQTLGSIRVHS